MSKKPNNPNVLSFTSLVWFQSVLLILILLGIFLVITQGPSFSLNEIVALIGGTIGITFYAYLITSPFYIIMLIVVYLFSRTGLDILAQKLLIFFVYLIPWLFIILANPNEARDLEGFIALSIVLIVPAFLIYKTPLQNKDQIIQPSESRDDLIDDINFEE